MITRLFVRARTAGHISAYLVGQFDRPTQMSAADARAGQWDCTRQSDPCLPRPHGMGSRWSCGSLSSLLWLQLLLSELTGRALGMLVRHTADLSRLARYGMRVC
jgi:hypothetical protein